MRIYLPAGDKAQRLAGDVLINMTHDQSVVVFRHADHSIYAIATPHWVAWITTEDSGSIWIAPNARPYFEMSVLFNDGETIDFGARDKAFDSPFIISVGDALLLGSGWSLDPATSVITRKGSGSVTSVTRSGKYPGFSRIEARNEATGVVVACDRLEIARSFNCSAITDVNQIRKLLPDVTVTAIDRPSDVGAPKFPQYGEAVDPNAKGFVAMGKLFESLFGIASPPITSPSGINALPDVQ